MRSEMIMVDVGCPPCSHEAATAWFGSEYGFGQVIGDFYGGANEAPVLIIKTAWGGHSLGGNFRPPSAVT